MQANTSGDSATDRPVTLLKETGYPTICLLLIEWGVELREENVTNYNYDFGLVTPTPFGFKIKLN